MPQLYNKAVITNAGLALLNKAQAGAAAIQFTRIAVGDGTYAVEEKTPSALRERDGLKSEKNSYALSSVDAASADGVKLTALLTNQDPVTGEALVTEGYYMNEIGLYAQEKDADGDTEVLYSVAVAMVENRDYMPPFVSGNAPAQIVQEYHAAVGNAANVTINYAGAAMLAEDAEKRLQEILEAIPPVDPELDSDSENPVQNKAVAGKIAELISQISTEWNAQKQYIDAKIADLIGGAPETLDTLKEVADAIQENETIVDALNAAIGNKVDKVAGKGLSTNDFTTDLMNKLNGTVSVGELTSCFKAYNFFSVGWHRVAKIQTSACNSCVVSLKIGYSYDNNECHKVELISTNDSVIFKSVYDKTNGNNLLLSRIRFVNSGSFSFIDVYYSRNSLNGMMITIGDGRNIPGKLWELLVDEIVPETSEGETVLAEFGFKANSWVGDSSEYTKYIKNNFNVNLNGKNVAYLRELLDNFSSEMINGNGVGGSFLADGEWMDLWNSEDVDTNISSGRRFAFKFLVGAGTNNYQVWLISSYDNVGIYIVTKIGNVWSKIKSISSGYGDQVSKYIVPKIELNDVFTELNPWQFTILKTGNVVNIATNIAGRMEASDGMQLLVVLPEEYRPSISVIHNYITQNGTPMIFQITPDGRVLLYNNNNDIVDAWICRQSITYIVG